MKTIRSISPQGESFPTFYSASQKMFLQCLMSVLTTVGLLIALCCISGCATAGSKPPREAGKGGWRITDGIRGKKPDRVFYSRLITMNFKTPQLANVASVRYSGEQGLDLGYDRTLPINSDENRHYPRHLGKDIDKATLSFVPEGGSAEVILKAGMGSERKFTAIAMPESQYLNEVATWNRALGGKSPSEGAAMPEGN